MKMTYMDDAQESTNASHSGRLISGTKSRSGVDNIHEIENGENNILRKNYRLCTSPNTQYVLLS